LSRVTKTVPAKIPEPSDVLEREADVRARDRDTIPSARSPEITLLDRHRSAQVANLRCLLDTSRLPAGDAVMGPTSNARAELRTMDRVPRAS
jgi:hypothetical protein